MSKVQLVVNNGTRTTHVEGEIVDGRHSGEYYFFVALHGLML